MKNRILYERVANKLKCSPNLIEYVAINMFKTIDTVIKDKDYFSIKIPGFANITLSLVKVNGVLRNKTIPELRLNRNNDECIRKFKQLWELRQKLIHQEYIYNKNRPKRFENE